MLSVVTLSLGPFQTNSYLLSDAASGRAAVVDPAGNGKEILAEAESRKWTIEQIWITHGHFDHLTGASAVRNDGQVRPLLYLHAEDRFLWENEAGARLFGLSVGMLPPVDQAFFHGQVLQLGDCKLEVRHAPGHTPGHVILYSASDDLAFCGDVIFANGIGRTDLPGGDYATLIESIKQQVMTLPDATRLLPGHGPRTSVERERVNFRSW
jgi:glyoxylase-like metal-dependent hydrolase (beta-lactamase superfamily II)